MINPMKRKSFFGKFDFNVSDSTTAYGQFLYNKTTATGQVGWSPTLFVVPTAPVTNPFIPADLRTILASRPTPGADFTINHRFMGLDTREVPTDFTTGQYILGLRGELPVKDWRWDIYGSYDTTDVVETQDKAILNSRMRNLLYAADGGAFIPLMTRGIPPNVVMALLLGAFLIHGLQPGPLMISQNPGVFWGIVASMYIGNLMLLVLNLPMIGMWVQLL